MRLTDPARRRPDVSRQSSGHNAVVRARIHQSDSDTPCNVQAVRSRPTDQPEAGIQDAVWRGLPCDFAGPSLSHGLAPSDGPAGAGLMPSFSVPALDEQTDPTNGGGPKEKGRDRYRQPHQSCNQGRKDQDSE